MSASRSVEIATSIFLLATEAHPASPEGYCIGIVVGRMLAQGLSHDEIRAAVGSALDATFAAFTRVVDAGPNGAGALDDSHEPKMTN